MADLRDYTGGDVHARRAAATRAAARLLDRRLRVRTRIPFEPLAPGRRRIALRSREPTIAGGRRSPDRRGGRTDGGDGGGMRAPVDVAYTRTAIALHWLAVLLILAGFSLGKWMVEQPIAPSTLRAYGYHKWIGITVFLVALVRLAWRRAHPVPHAGGDARMATARGDAHPRLPVRADARDPALRMGLQLGDGRRGRLPRPRPAARPGGERQGARRRPQGGAHHAELRAAGAGRSSIRAPRSSTISSTATACSRGCCPSFRAADGTRRHGSAPFVAPLAVAAARGDADGGLRAARRRRACSSTGAKSASSRSRWAPASRAASANGRPTWTSGRRTSRNRKSSSKSSSPASIWRARRRRPRSVGPSGSTPRSSRSRGSCRPG